MNEMIDSALARMMTMTEDELNSLDTASLTIADRIAISIIHEAFENGGSAMKLLVERVGGTPIAKNINVIKNERSESIVHALEDLLGGSHADAVLSITAEDDDEDKDDDVQSNSDKNDDCGLLPKGFNIKKGNDND